ncbi:DUF5947 family protein [Actinoallomurus purpureus]|uniref:DUF5947 family protein n=1 Tax=Actinoallomurus purpureus TaxID=478114 RepID=UPI002092BD44|nr:DUF5947 family protein [Actinoallomurus purpureus]MCO6005570.1 DUF5947 family protein [Actinoallomurus purpureus]
MTAGGLRRLRQPPAADGERCEICAEPLGERHGHVVNLESRALLCTCPPCHLLFTQDGAGRGRFRAVPDRHLHTRDFRMSAADWEDLQIPVRMAFFFYNSALGRDVAFYPSPGGATESQLPLDTWERVLAANPVMAGVRPDVEALLVDRCADDRFACHLVPIDACYELVGIVRLHWRGFAGGQEAWEAIDDYFAALRERGREVVPEEAGDG